MLEDIDEKDVYWFLKRRSQANRRGRLRGSRPPKNPEPPPAPGDAVPPGPPPTQ